MFVYGKLSPCCFLVALILMDRLAHHLKGIIVSNFNVHRMYVTCVLISTKYLDDIFFSNAHWAKIAGLSVAEMNALEMDVLFMLDWNVHVRPEEYMRYRSSIMALIPDATRAGVQVDIVPVAERYFLHAILFFSSIHTNNAEANDKEGVTAHSYYY